MRRLLITKRSIFILLYQNLKFYVRLVFVISSCVFLLGHNQSWGDRIYHKFRHLLYHQGRLVWQRSIF